jgi:lipid-binding SYLF domain-containing protein
MSSLAQNLLTKLRDALVGLRTEESVLKKLHRSSKSTLARLQKLKPGLDDRLKEAHGYAVFPVVGEAALVAGAAYGTGEVFEQGSLVGYAALVQLSVGVQLGGDTFSQVILFHNKQSIDRFKQGKLAF